jgi:hypothetical protein
MASTYTPSMRRLILLAATIREDLSRATLEGESSAKEKRQALQMLEDTAAVMRRVLGPVHPDTLRAQGELEVYQRIGGATNL